MDIVKDDQSQVWGIVYEINEIDIEKLDKNEGFVPGRQRNAYQRIECVVCENGDENKSITVNTYEVVEKAPKTILPNQAYKSLIVNGAEFWNLPEDYLDLLKLIKTTD